MIFILFLYFCWLQIVPILGKFPDEGQEQSFLLKIYDDELAANDGTGELREFVGELDEQNLVMEEAFPPPVVHHLYEKYYLNKLQSIETQKTSQRKSSKIKLKNIFRTISDGSISKLMENAGKVSGEYRQKKLSLFKEAKLLREKWEIAEQKDPALASTFTLLRTSLYAVKGGASNRTIVEELKKHIVKAAFLLADRMQIPRDQIIPSNKKNLKLLKQLAKLWAQMKFNGKRKVKSNENREERERMRQSERQMLKLILAAVDDWKPTALDIATKDAGDGLPRRRRKKRDIFVVFVVVFAIIILTVFFTVSQS
ncbi:hypothetical protein GPALN_005745 [Globodera pallida]|nr:hypothetical protein GPALN_005745 [Globodera pallida]